jgi:hypothetical protein
MNTLRRNTATPIAPYGLRLIELLNNGLNTMVFLKTKLWVDIRSTLKAWQQQGLFGDWPVFSEGIPVTTIPPNQYN